MLLNTWLSAARRHFAQKSVARRTARSTSRNSVRTESLEARSLLTALVINPDTKGGYLNAAGGIEIDNADMVGKDGLVIEGFAISATSGDALSINLSGISLKHLAIESMTVTQYTTLGFDINLTGVTGLRTIAIEDVQINGTARGIDLSLSNTDVKALTVDDSRFPGLKVSAINGSDIGESVVTENTIAAGLGVEGILLEVNAGTADNFHVVNNQEVSSVNRDFLRVNATNAPVDGLQILDNSIGTITQGAGIVFRAEGDTFEQSMVLTNNSTRNEWLQTFVLDLTSLGLEFDTSVQTGKPFTPAPGSQALTGMGTPVISADNKTLTLTFTDFAPGESIPFVIDIDRAGGQAAAIFGDNLIGADIVTTMENQAKTATRLITGQMIGDPNKTTASSFAVGPRTAGTTQGIVINLSNAPTTNMMIQGNTVQGAPGHALLLDADSFSDMTGVIKANDFSGSGRDGIRFNMVDSNFTGAVLDNVIQNNGENGIGILPTTSRSGLVERVQDLSEVVITSVNHGLSTGDQIILQGLVNDNPAFNHPANGFHTITRLTNDRFRLNLVDGTATNIGYRNGGTWYVPDFKPDGTARGLVTIDMQNTVPQGTVRAATNAGPIVITSPNHGLTSGQRVRVSNVNGNTAANGVFKITVVNADTFRLDGTTGNGVYNPGNGFGMWKANVITAATNSANLEITSTAHGLKTGEEVRISGVLGNSAANGVFKVAVLSADTFRLIGAVGNGVYSGGGTWVRLNEATSTGDLLPQRLGGNTINANGGAGILVDVTVGTVFNGDLVSNTLRSNAATGINVKSHSFGLGMDLPFPATTKTALPTIQDIGYYVNIGTNAPGDGNLIDQNSRAGILLEALDYGTARFNVLGNTVSNSVDDPNDRDPSTTGDGIAITLERDLSTSESIALFSESVIDGNFIGVDDGGNQGHGVKFAMAERTRIQDLQLTNTVFLNNALDGFNFTRSADAYLNSLVIEKNRSTNNKGDGFDIFSKNTTKDEQDFFINENIIDNNGQYGVRMDLQANVRAAVEFNRNSVTENGTLGANTGFHPDDGVPGSFRSAGGVGIRVLEEIALRWTMSDTRIDRNIGDGFSINADIHDDVLTTHFDATNSTFNGNTLTGFRNQGTSYGSFTIVGSEFNDNLEDGVRMVSVTDKNDTLYRRRIGGRDIDVSVLDTEFMGNNESGIQLGQGVSAVFGDGTVANANYFNDNGEDGLKLTQHNSPHADRLGLRRLIQTNRNFFQNNGSNGIDVGHDAGNTTFPLLREPGNGEHGDEVATDINLVVNNAVITNNVGDGVEYLADSQLEVPRVTGGNQDVGFLARSSMTLSNSRVASNGGRGIDILNRRNSDSFIYIINNDILSNDDEGVYVVNAAAGSQLQGSSRDVLAVEVTDTVGGQIELRVQDNLIESNGNAADRSRVQKETTPSDFWSGQSTTNNPGNDGRNGVNVPGRDKTGQAYNGTINYLNELVSDWAPDTELISGTLGGLVVRVGSLDSVGSLAAANAGLELGQSGIDAEVLNNSFDGNFGPDVYFDNFTSGLARQSFGAFNAPPEGFAFFGVRDPLSRFDLSFRGNVGNELDVMNGFAYQDNWESEFKSRNGAPLNGVIVSSDPAPGHGHQLVDPGHWDQHPNRLFSRKRNQTRTTGLITNQMGDVPGAHNFPSVPINWSYDGTGTSTWRVESDFDFNNFVQTSSTDGYSDFFTEVNFRDEQFFVNSLYQYQWDTGINTGSFTGQTPFSLVRGDIFNVRAGENPIVADDLDDNNGFVSAFDLGKLAGAGNLVNDRTVDGNLNLHVKGDRDYFRFTAAGTGALDVNLNLVDTLGDNLRYMIYEVSPTNRTEEVAKFLTPGLLPAYFTVNGGGTTTASTTVVAGREYVIEILSDEFASTGFTANGKPFNYGTTRSYRLSIDAPAAPPGGSSVSSGNSTGAGAGTVSGGGSVSGPTSVESGGAGSGTSGGSIPGARPTASFVALTPDPRSVSAGAVTLNFTEDVTGVDIADFKLTRNGVDVPLTAGLLTQVSAMRYSLNLNSISANPGTYLLTLKATGSGIRDTENLSLLVNATETWVTSTGVNTTTDTPDTNVGDRLARDINGKMSLRAGVMESNSVIQSLDVIQLGSAVYVLTAAGRFEDDAVTGDLDIKGATTIRGVSAAATIINAFDLDRVFHVFAGATLTLENLTIRGGEAFDGGAIFNEGTVVLKNVNIIGNEAFNQGGGIFNARGAVLNATNASISSNLAGSRGGAVNNVGTTSYLNTTFSSNIAVSRGGGIFNEGTAASRLINVTMARNEAASRGAGLASEAARTSTLGNTIIEANITDARVPANGATINRDLMGVVISIGNNFIQVLDRRSTTATGAGLLTTDTFGRDATPLVTLTSPIIYTRGNGVGIRPLIPGRRAIDGGSNSVYPSNNLLRQKDAVGNPRLIEGNRDGVVTIDAGAAEHLVNTPVAIFTATPNPASFGDRVTFDGRGSTHPNPAVGSIVLWEWDYDFNSGNGFVPRLTGSVVTRTYPVSAKTNYIVRLRVTDNFGNTGFIDKVVVIGAPTKPEVDRPGTFTTDRTPTFRWSADPATYDVELFNVTTGTRVPVFPRISMTAKTYTPTTPLALGKYELVVTARNSNFSTSSDAYKFTVTNVFGLVPSRNIFDVTPKFSWNGVPGSSRYELKVRRVLPTVKEGVISDAFISDTFFEPTTSLGLGTFEWQVRAFDVDGVAGEWSNVQTVTTGLIAFVKPAPVTVDTTPIFTWTDMDSKPVGKKDTRYELWVNRVGGQAKFIVESAITTTSYTPKTPLPNGTYDAWVRPLAPDGEAGLWSQVRRFVMDYRVGPVTTSPEGVTTDTTPTFRWQAADSAASYDLWVDNLSTGVQEVIRVSVPHKANAAEISYTPAKPLTAGNYRWWVQTVATSGLKTTFSAGTDFTVPVPTIVNPRGSIATNLPLFTWNGVAEYVSYELWVNNVTTGAKEVLRVSGITSRSYQTTLPLENGDFKAWVRGFDKDGNVSQWSGAADFNVTVGVGVAPVLGNSFRNANGTQTFDWSAGTGAFSYEIIVKRISDPSQSVVLNVSNISGTTYTTPAPLTSGIYRWWIRGLDANGNGLPWSQPEVFFVNSTEPLVPGEAPDFILAMTNTTSVFDVNAGIWTEDAVRSITATPAGTVVQVDPVATISVVGNNQPVALVAEEEVAGIDDVMQEWDMFSMDDTSSSILPVVLSSASVPVAPPEKSGSDSQSRALDILMAGMALGTVISRSRKSGDE